MTVSPLSVYSTGHPSLPGITSDSEPVGATGGCGIGCHAANGQTQ